MAQNDSPPSLQACAVRLSRLAVDGSTPAGATNGYCSNQFAKLTWKPEIEAGVEFAIRNGCGQLATVYKDRDIMKRYALDLELQVPDPEIHELMVGASLVTSGGFTVGHDSPPLAVNPNTYNFGVCVELWTKAIIVGQQATTNPWFRWVFPASFWTLSDKNAENADMKVHLVGFCTEPTSLFGNGPWNDLTPNLTRAYRAFRDTTLPAQQAGYIAVPVQV